jgi:hypothetical protein
LAGAVNANSPLNSAMPDSAMPESDNLDAQLRDLRSSINDLGYEVDSYKTRTAAALGAGVFVLFLAAGAAYDLVAGRGGVWSFLGVNRQTLVWMAFALGVGALILLSIGFRRVRLSDTGRRAKLDLMEREYAELLERKTTQSEAGCE